MKNDIIIEFWGADDNIKINGRGEYTLMIIGIVLSCRLAFDRAK